MEKKTEKPSAKNLSFEEALSRLEEIARAMESGRLGLEDMLSSFREGQQLVAFCTAKLGEVERKIDELVKAPGGGYTGETRPFDEGSEA